ncbi:MAG: hypothetical protein ACPGDA_10605 [Paracoccaceae bacterium]
MREQLLEALKAHAQGQIAKHKANIEVYMNQVVGIGEHSDIVETLELELDKIAEAHDRLEVINKYFE